MMNVVIVGNGAGALSSYNGEFIDSCDVVIRINKWPAHGYEQYVGMKTDIYSAWVGRYDKSDPEFLAQFKFCWLMEHELCLSTEFINETNLNIIKSKNVKCLSTEDYTNMKYMLNYKGDADPSTGFCTIYKAIQIYNQDNIYITGFDSYIKSNWYWSECKQPQLNIAAGAGKEGHPFIKESRCISKLNRTNVVQII